MANTIADFSGDGRIVMTNARFARPLPSAFLSGWTKIRVALFLQLVDSAADITGTPRFAVGLCAGSTNIIGDTTTDHFVGVMSTSATWTRSTSAIRYSSIIGPSKRVGTTITPGTAFATTMTMHTTNPALFFVDITKGSPNYTVQGFYNAAVGAAATTEANFLSISVMAVPAHTNHVLPAAQTIAADEDVDGVLNHACVWWNQTTPTISVGALRVYRLA